MRQPAGVEDSLIREIVDREDRRQAAQDGARRVHPRQEHRDETSLPVVRVDDVVGRTRFDRPVERGLAQEGEALRVVQIVVAGRAVEVVAIEVSGVVDEDRPDSLV